jgi:antitoxin PrlF
MTIATLTSKGQLTLPAEIRRDWNIAPGDKVEFYADHRGTLCVRRFNAGPLDFLDGIPERPALPGVGSDEEAVARAVAERDARSRSEADAA